MKADRTDMILSALKASGQLPRTTREIAVSPTLRPQVIASDPVLMRVCSRSISPPG